MIQSIINELKGSKELLEHYDLSSQLHYALISSGSYRTYQKGRINIVIFNEDGNPLFFLKFYKDKQMNKLIEHEFEKQLFLCTTYKNLKIPKPLALLNINGFSIMVEEAFNGKTLSRILSENLSIESVIEVIDYGKKVQDDLNDNLLLSSFSEFEHELNDLIHTFTSIYNPTPFEDFLIKKYTDVFIEQFKHKQIYKRFTNGDFVPKNVILSSGCLPVLIDFEFVEETHLYFLDWFRFFTHYFNVPPEIIQHILEHKFDDYSLNAALFRFRDPKELVNNTTIGAMWLVFHIKDFVIKSYVMPGHQLKKEREHLRSMLTSLLSSVFSHDQEIIDLIRDDHIKGLEAGLQEREQRIDELDVAVQAKDVQIKDLEGQITDISGQLTEKDKQLDALNVAVQGKDAQISDFEGQITDFSEQVKEKEQQIEELNVAVREKDTQLRNFDELKTTISSYIKEKDKQMDELDITIQESDEQIRDLEEQITDISGRQKEKEQRITELNVALQGKDEQILNLDGQIANISGQRKEREERLGEIRMENLRINSELNSIKSSVTWRTMIKWHSFVENVMPQGTKRRRWYDQRLIRLRTSANEDWRISSGNDKEHGCSKKN